MYSMKAKTEKDFSLLTKANSLRETVTGKKVLVKSPENASVPLEKELKLL